MDGIASRTVGRTGLRISELGFGASPLGNLFRVVSDTEAREAIDTATAAGIRYIDTAPYYGFGLSERRVGDSLRGRDDVVISTKVGRLLNPSSAVHDDCERHGFRSPMPFEPRYDYSYDGIMRSHEASLQRLGLARIDILYVHDIGKLTHDDCDTETFAQLTNGGGFAALERLRDQGAITAFGLGVNECEICLRAMDYARLDVILLAGRYTLLEQGALDEMLPRCAAAGISIVIGGPYNSGILASGVSSGHPTRYDYGPAPAWITARVAAIEAVCMRHKVPLAAAALQFPLAHRQVASVIPGMGTPARIDQTLGLHRHAIPVRFWAELKEEGLLRHDAPVPTGKGRDE